MPFQAADARVLSERSQAARWAADLEGVAGRLDRHFVRSEGRRRARAYLRGLLGGAERKNGWQLAEAAGDRTPHGVQHLLGRARWSADAVRDDLQSYVREHLADPGGILVLDETGFLKKGAKSVGVARQYSGTAGRIENSQIGVFAAYVSPGRGGARTLIDRALYLPKAWTQDPARCRAAGVPQEVAFATKPRLARELIARAVDDAGLPCAWVVADSVYGGDGSLRLWLEERRQSYVLAVTSQYRLFDGQRREWAATLVNRLPARAWKTLSCGAGSKGERRYRWTSFVVRQVGAERCRWLLARRGLEDAQADAFFVVSAPKETTLQEMVTVAGARWAIEECFQVAKGELGLDHYEVRSWAGWQRHVTLAMLAQAYLAVLRAGAQGAAEVSVPGKVGQRKKGVPRAAAPGCCP